MPTVCAKCRSSFKKAQPPVLCELCKCSYHQQCASLSEDDVHALKELQSSWTCPTCVNSARALRDDSTPVRPKSAVSTKEDLNKVEGHILAELLARMKQLQADNCDLKTTIAAWKVSLDDHAKLIEKVNVSISNLGDRLDAVCSENKRVNERLTKLEQYVNETEQKSLKNVIEIHGIPKCDGEVEEVVCKVTRALGIDISVMDIDYCFQPKSRANNGVIKPAPVIARFMRSSVADRIVSARRVKRYFTTKDIDMNEVPNQPIFVNESLTQTNRNLYAKAKNLKRSGKLKYLWVRGGKIFVRKTDGSERIVIRSDDDIDNLGRVYVRKSEGADRIQVNTEEDLQRVK